MQTWNEVIRLADHPLPPDRRVEKTDAEWRQLLTPEQYRVARQHGTERAFTGEYCEAHDPGLYACICCGTPAYDSRTKFESGTGWPSFHQPVKENAVQYRKDTSYGMTRVEVLCNVCDAHQGHVFPDGPAPSRLRYCINSASIQLVSEPQPAQPAE
ncbi:MAG: peptide-methionine (R)-S-oxide reductase MsrB [Ferruginibacter sp.]|nr:peptide-methionine (R)-S-oxide reductase MsrB [Cytophagales bacterium]